MKKNVTKLFIVVILPLVIMAIIFGTSGQKTSSKYEVGPVAVESLSSIIGGASEQSDRCGQNQVECGTGVAVHPACSSYCNSYNITTGWTYDADEVFYTEYANTGNWNAVGNGNLNMAALVNNFNVECKKVVVCKPTNVINPGSCMGTTCHSSPLPGACHSYTDPDVIPAFTRYNKGQCVDP
jgi:hypothetical protein